MLPRDVHVAVRGHGRGRALLQRAAEAARRGRVGRLGDLRSTGPAGRAAVVRPPDLDLPEAVLRKPHSSWKFSARRASLRFVFFRRRALPCRRVGVRHCVLRRVEGLHVVPRTCRLRGAMNRSPSVARVVLCGEVGVVERARALSSIHGSPRVRMSVPSRSDAPPSVHIWPPSIRTRSPTGPAAPGACTAPNGTPQKPWASFQPASTFCGIVSVVSLRPTGQRAADCGAFAKTLSPTRAARPSRRQDLRCRR